MTDFWAVFVPYDEIVPGPVRWFWEAVEEGRVPWLYPDTGRSVLGQYSADPEETPFILCPDDIERAKWAVGLISGARHL